MEHNQFKNNTSINAYCRNICSHETFESDDDPGLILVNVHGGLIYEAARLLFHLRLDLDLNTNYEQKLS